MLDPVELQLFPSCYNCISWSSDGELAVAAGEYIHILTPKIAGHDVNEQQPTSQTATTASPWSFTRFRANVFTNKEWPTTYPQSRDNFSIGPEQSISTVAGLAWSPPGLATHKRCVLAVLTTNLLLSFFEPTGPQGKWVRVAVVNHALKSQFFIPSSSSSSSSRGPESSGLSLRKRAIRAFAWNPPLRAKGAAHARAESESRWGVHLLTVANDDNDVILLRVKRQRGELVSDFYYSTEVLSVLPFNDDASGNFPMVQPSTLLSAAIRSRVRASHIACGPWVCQQAEDDESRGRLSAKAAVAIVYGTRLKIVRLDVTLVPKDRQVDFGSKYTLEANSAEHASTASDKSLGTYHFTGPVQWLFENGLQSVCLAAGISAGLVTLRMSRETYEGKITDPKGIQLQERPSLEDSSNSSSQVDGSVQSRHWEPISAMAAVCDEKTGVSTLHLGTMGGYADSYSCPSLEQEGHFAQPDWKKQLEDFRERFDIDRDLGGFAVAKVWGLTCHRGFMAAAFTMHPGDMVEYTTAADEKTTIVFSPVSAETAEVEGRPAFLQTVPKFTDDELREKRQAALEFVLDGEDEDQYRDPWSQKLIYAAAACSIVDTRDGHLLELSRNALERLAKATGADLSDEISKCSPASPAPNTFAPKSADQLSIGGDMFERCGICGSGMEWYSAREAQCMDGHPFVRCGLTFLAIPEPDISKFCSLCGTEFLNDEVFGPPPPPPPEVKREDEGVPPSLTPSAPTTPSISKSKFHMLFEVFDTCLYCEGKFRD